MEESGLGERVNTLAILIQIRVLDDDHDLSRKSLTGVNGPSQASLSKCLSSFPTAKTMSINFKLKLGLDINECNRIGTEVGYLCHLPVFVF